MELHLIVGVPLKIATTGNKFLCIKYKKKYHAHISSINHGIKISIDPIIEIVSLERYLK